MRNYRECRVSHRQVAKRHLQREQSLVHVRHDHDHVRGHVRGRDDDLCGNHDRCDHYDRIHDRHENRLFRLNSVGLTKVNLKLHHRYPMNHHCQSHHYLNSDCHYRVDDVGYVRRGALRVLPLQLRGLRLGDP